MRILMVTPTSFFSDYGGHIRILEETRALQALGHEVAIVTYNKGSDLPGLDIRRTPPLPWHNDYEVGSSRHKYAFDVYLMWQTMVEALRFRPDIIHGHMHEGALIGGIVAKLLRKPLVFDFQGSLTGEMVDHHFLKGYGRRYTVFHRLEQFIDNYLSSAILTSSIQAATLLKDDFRVPAANIHPLPDCAVPHQFDPTAVSPQEKQALREQLGIPNGRLIIAYLGLLTDYQGIPHLIQTAVRLKAAGENVHFLIMGYPSVEHYQTLANNFKVNDIITFTGKIEYRDAPRYLSLGDIAVAPKMSNTEGSGKLLNYMALEQPIVLYDSPVHREYLADLGVYAPMGDMAAFSDALQALIHDPERRATLGPALRYRAITEYSWTVAAKQIVALYEELLTN
jgi:glycosyltransferase involved in cell wall biosynthesis